MSATTSVPCLAAACPRPTDFDPVALRGFVNRVLAARFDLEIYVNQQCQHPCGPRALETADAAR